MSFPILQGSGPGDSNWIGRGGKTSGEAQPFFEVGVPSVANGNRTATWPRQAKKKTGADPFGSPHGKQRLGVSTDGKTETTGRPKVNQLRKSGCPR